MTTSESQRRWVSKHTLIMVLCCVMPLGILGILWAVGVSGRYLVIGAILLCTLLHVFLMRGMHGRQGDGRDHGH